jgi:hypothetical protein
MDGARLIDKSVIGDEPGRTRATFRAGGWQQKFERPF